MTVTPPRPPRVRTDTLPMRPELAQQAAAPSVIRSAPAQEAAPPTSNAEAAPSTAPPTSTPAAAPSTPATAERQPVRAPRKRAAPSRTTPDPREEPRAATSENTATAQGAAPSPTADVYAYVGFLLEREDPTRFRALLASGQETVDFLDVLRRSR